MKGVFFSTGTHIPSSRYRVQQLLPVFERHGVSSDHFMGYGPLYNRVTKTRFGLAYKFAGRAKRALLEMSVSREADFVFFQRKAFRECVFPEEIAHMRNRRVIFDFDDSVFLGANGENHPLRQRSFERMCSLSDQIICGNEWLAAQAGFPEKTTVIPTVIDTDHYAPEPREHTQTQRDCVIVGWMGTQSSFVLMHPYIDALKAVLDRHDHVRLRLVSNAQAPQFAGHPKVEQIPWSAEREVELLRSFDIGLMPLEENNLTRGKCGFKMVLYMAVGCPVAASAVGANVSILEGSGAGRLVGANPNAWIAALGEMIKDDELRTRMGHAARARAVSAYSIESVLPAYLSIFDKVSVR